MQPLRLPPSRVSHCITPAVKERPQRALTPGARFNLCQEEKSDESATDCVLVVTERVCASR